MVSHVLCVMVVVLMWLQRLDGIFSGVEGCQDNCEKPDRLQGPTRMVNTRPHPWNVASFPTKNNGFCKLGCQYFFSENPEISKCKAECMAAYRYRVTAVYSDAAEEAIANCQDGCDIAIQVCQSGFFCKNGTTQAVTMDALTSERSIMCYRDAGNSGGATCNIIIPTGRQDGTAGLAKGTPIVVNNVNSGPTYFHSVAYIAPKGKAILCYQDKRESWIPRENMKGRCVEMYDESYALPPLASYATSPANTLSVGGGTDFDSLFFNLRPTSHISVFAVGARSVVCFRDDGGDGAVTCRTIVFDALTEGLKTGGEAIVSTLSGRKIHTATMSDTTGIACFEDEGADSATTCGYMTVGDDALGELTLTDSATVGPTNTSDTQVVRLTDTRAGVCFRDLLTGLPHCAEVDVDTDLLLSSGPVSYSVSANITSDLTMVDMTSTLAVLCYRTEPLGYGVCSALSFADASTAPVTVSSVTISMQNTESLSVSRTLGDLAMVCYRNTGRGGKGTCTEVMMDFDGGNIRLTNSLIINDDMMLPCPPGRFRQATQGDLVRDCINCPAGRYRYRNKGKSPDGCKACPIGKYAAVTGSVQVSDCLRCPAGKTAEQEGMGECKCITGRSCDLTLTDANGDQRTYYEEPDIVDFFRESVPYVGRS